MFLLQAFDRINGEDRKIVQSFLNADSTTLESSVIREIRADTHFKMENSLRDKLLCAFKYQRSEDFFSSVGTNYSKQFRFFRATTEFCDPTDPIFMTIYEFGRDLKEKQQVLNEDVLEYLPPVFAKICDEARNKLRPQGDSWDGAFRSSHSYRDICQQAFDDKNHMRDVFDVLDKYTLHASHFFNELEDMISVAIREDMPITYLHHQLEDTLTQNANILKRIKSWRGEYTSMLMDKPEPEISALLREVSLLD